jgi:branched-chain amino acid aminotransferase
MSGVAAAATTKCEGDLMPLKVWLDGKLLDRDDAKISVYDHGLLYGDGVFEGIRAYAGRIFRADQHLRRLYDSAKAIRLAIPLSPEQFLDAIQQTIKANNFTDCYIRAVVTRGVGYLGLSPSKCVKPSVFIIADSIEMYPREMYEKGMSVITASVIRNHPNAVSPRIKSLNYLNNILAKMEASDAGVSEAIMLNHQGHISECTADNIFLVRDGIVSTPTTHDGILEGVTRATIIDLCGKLGIPCQEKTLGRHDAYVADECFLTGTGAEVIPVTQVDKRPVGSGTPGPITRRLIEAFHKHVREG